MKQNDSAAIRHKLYDYIRVADDKKLHAIYNLLESEIEETMEWWKNKAFVAELDQRYEALESGNDKGYSVEQLEASIDKLRKKRYGK
jgi:3-phenylpropionate/cinnamic acid dioxygenase small subunit